MGRIQGRLRSMGDAPAYRCGESVLSARALLEQSSRLATRLQTDNPSRAPVLIYGHKQPLIPVCILACMLAGIPYVPVDSSTPVLRAANIAQSAGAALLLAVEQLELPVKTLTRHELETVCAGSAPLRSFPDPHPNDLCYILFTSGSTGVPKGVCITYGNLSHFLGWMEQLRGIPAHGTVLNQAQFSFDLSVADLHHALYSGKTVYALERETQQDFRLLFHHLAESNANLAVMTPSFAQYCLLDRSFCRELLPHLRCIFFCGEPLLPKIAAKLFERFPGLHILNAYGPTETTVAVCAAEITSSLCRLEHLPVAHLPCDSIVLLDENEQPVPAGARGQIIIHGPSVGSGYLGAPSGGYRDYLGHPGFSTGDLGIVQDGMLFCLGRNDRQVKRGGHRIELAEIECCLGSVESVALCAVVAGGAPLRITAYVQPVVGHSPDTGELRQYLSRHLPEYLLPDRICFAGQIPLNNNGKIDYSTLEGVSL